jgi:hypothetical protein
MGHCLLREEKEGKKCPRGPFSQNGTCLPFVLHGILLAIIIYLLLIDKSAIKSCKTDVSRCFLGHGA